MNVIEVSAFAKINLAIDIVSKRNDGYHNMRMVMQSVTLRDDLRIERTGGTAVTASSNLPYIPDDRENIAVSAAEIFFRETGIKSGVAIKILKKIPVGAGLAGGSADAAAVLRGLNRMFSAGLSADDLRKMGETIGSDVPFCVEGGTVLTEGRGTELTELPPLPHCHIVICKPEFSISTPSLFKRVRLPEIISRPDIAGMVAGIGSGDIAAVSRRMYNVFENFLPRKYGEIEQIKGSFLDFGSLGAVMTGTGSAVFGIFDSAEKAVAAFEFLKGSYRDVFLTEPLSKIPV